MSVLRLSPVLAQSPPLFSYHWLGRHPQDHLPRVVHCFGPSARDDHAAEYASLLGLKAAISRKSPTLSKVYAELDGQRLVLYSRGRELMRTDSLPLALAAVLRSRAEMLLVWVDFPLRDPRTELTRVGFQHVWTGIAPVDGRDPAEAAQVPQLHSAGA
jgi:hypothetical protein